MAEKTLNIHKWRGYRTLHAYNLIWAVCHLFPRQRWRTHTYSVSGNHWPGEPRDPLKTTSARKFSSGVWEPLPRHVFSINTSSSSTLSLFTQFLRSGKNTPSSVTQQSSNSNNMEGPRRNTSDQEDFFQSQRNRLFPTIKRKTF